MSLSIITDKNFQIQIGNYNLYKCAYCRKNDIKTHYNFCPHCGKKLKFNLKENYKCLEKEQEY